MHDLNTVVKKYIELRDDLAMQAAEAAERAKPAQEAMAVIETYLLREMEKMGVDSLKTPSGTPYKAVSKSVKLQDAESFKKFVFAPVVDALSKLPNMPDIMALLTAGIRWDMIDFRAGKKGIVEHLEETGEVPPGITFDSFTKINIRRS